MNHYSEHDMDNPAPLPQLLPEGVIAHWMYLLWLGRKELQLAYDIQTPDGQARFLKWCLSFKPSSTPTGQNTLKQRVENALRFWAQRLPLSWQRLAKSVWFNLLAQLAKYKNFFFKSKPHAVVTQSKEQMAAEKAKLLPGANLIGYAQGEFGLGEDVRTGALALQAAQISGGILNFNWGVVSRQQAGLYETPVITTPAYQTNIFYMNPGQMIQLLSHWGRSIFEGHYNIGFWPWELAEFPEAWCSVFSLVDEVWAMSDFVQRAIAAKTEKPVIKMPSCVYLPIFPKKEKKDYGLPNDHFLFLFTFDFLGGMARKNPWAAIRAFRRAFPDRRQRVGLVFKVMNVNYHHPKWHAFLEEIDADPRVFIIENTLDRAALLGLMDTCDAFVSLHRAEGFGRTPAEAMMLGKPVIVTDYSGNTDFTRSDNACLVNYQLIPIAKEEYPFGEGQVWADADVDQAAFWMDRLAVDPSFGQALGEKARSFMLAHHSPKAVGRLYAARWQALR